MNEQLSEEEMLRRLREEQAPEAPSDLAARIWAELSPQLRTYRRPVKMQWRLPALAFAVGVLAVFAFLAGRIWEKSQGSTVISQRTAERILLTATGEHLERSERFLVELRMSRAPSPELTTAARELLNDNRLYEQSAVFAHDAAMADVLDRLGRVLAEVAHGDGATLGLDDLIRAVRTEQRRNPMQA